MFRSAFLLPSSAYQISSVIQQLKNSCFNLGILITFHCQSVLCNSRQHKFISTTGTSLVEMGEKLSTNSSTFFGNVDRHKGVHIKSIEEPCDSTSFACKLEASLKCWTSQKMQAAWFLVHSEHADWVPILAKNGFRFHHTLGDEVAMVRWLSPTPSRIPVYAHTMIGAGAVVVNNEGELLVVQESFRGSPYWKLPGGYVEPGEDISKAAMREVMEETNIKTEFKSVVAFRHAHGAPFGCSDIYFIVELTPLSDAITSCEHEIEDCQWMPIDTFLHHPNVHENNRLFVRKYLFSKEKGCTIIGTKTAHPVTKAPQMLFGIGSTSTES